MENSFSAAAASVSESGGETIESGATIDVGQDANGNAPPAPPGAEIGSNGNDPWSLTEEFNTAADITPEMDQPVGQTEQNTARERFQESWEQWQPNVPEIRDGFDNAASSQSNIGTTAVAEDAQLEALLREREMLENGRARLEPHLDLTIGGTIEQQVHTEIEAEREARIREINANLQVFQETLENEDELEEEDGLSL